MEKEIFSRRLKADKENAKLDDKRVFWGGISPQTTFSLSLRTRRAADEELHTLEGAAETRSLFSRKDRPENILVDKSRRWTTAQPDSISIAVNLYIHLLVLAMRRSPQQRL